jgi:hypothetical protein
MKNISNLLIDDALSHPVPTVDAFMLPNVDYDWFSPSELMKGIACTSSSLLIGKQ